MARYRLVRKDSLDAAALAEARPLAIGDLDMDLLVEYLLPTSPTRSRAKLRMQLEDQMAAALESAMRGKAASFLDIYEYQPAGVEPGGIHKVRRVPGPVLKELAESHCFVAVAKADILPQPLILRDLKSGAVNERLSRGGKAELRGVYIAFDREANDEGVYLTDLFDAAEHKLAAEPAKVAEDALGMQTLVITIPNDLPGGQYALNVRARPDGSKLRIGSLPAELRVDD